MTRVLAVDTATTACSAAVCWDDECREVLRLERNRHAEILLPMVQSLLEEGGWQLHQLDALAFGSGPGSFTGLRIGIAVIQGLALGAGLPVVPVSSLWAVAARAGVPRVLAAIDARMNQVYWNIYRRGEDGRMRAQQGPAVSYPEDVRLPDDGRWTAAGSGCDAYFDRLAADRSGLAPVYGVHPHAGDIARTAQIEFAAGNALDPERAAPEYVRNEIAQA